MPRSRLYERCTNRLEMEAIVLRQVGRIVSDDDNRFMVGRKWQVRDGRKQLLKTLDFNKVSSALEVGRYHDRGELAIESRFLFVKVLPGPLATERFFTANRVNAPVAV